MGSIGLHYSSYHAGFRMPYTGVSYDRNLAEGSRNLLIAVHLGLIKHHLSDTLTRIQAILILMEMRHSWCAINSIGDMTRHLTNLSAIRDLASFYVMVSHHALIHLRVDASYDEFL